MCNIFYCIEVIIMLDNALWITYPKKEEYSCPVFKRCFKKEGEIKNVNKMKDSKRDTLYTKGRWLTCSQGIMQLQFGLLVP